MMAVDEGLSAGMGRRAYEAADISQTWYKNFFEIQ
jgi:hypothetical protein